MPNTGTHSLSIQVYWKNWLLGQDIWIRTVLENLELMAVCAALLSVLTIFLWYTLCCFYLCLSIESYLKLHGLMTHCSHRAHEQYKCLFMIIWHVTCPTWPSRSLDTESAVISGKTTLGCCRGTVITWNTSSTIWRRVGRWRERISKQNWVWVGRGV